MANIHPILPRGCLPYLAVGIGHHERQVFLGQETTVFVPSVTMHVDRTHLPIFRAIVAALEALPEGRCEEAA